MSCCVIARERMEENRSRTVYLFANILRMLKANLLLSLG